MSFTYTFCPEAFACIVNCAAFRVTAVDEFPIDPLSLTSTTCPAGCDPVPAIPALPLVAIFPVPVVAEVSSRKKRSVAAVPTVDPLIVTALVESLKYAEVAAVAVRLAVLVANGDVHEVPIVPVVSVTFNVPAVTVSPVAVNT